MSRSQRDGHPPGPPPRIFNPFFTTKTGHWGTSLGPSQPHEIVKNTRGEIIVDSESQ